MVAGSFTREQVSATSPDRLWKEGILDVHNLLPRLLPEIVTSVEIIEGEGGVGTVTKFNFTEAVKQHRFLKEITEAMDHEKHIYKVGIIEGGFIGIRLKSYSIVKKLEAGSNGGTLWKIEVEYDTLDDTALTSEEEDHTVADLLVMIKAVDDHLSENPTAIA